MLQCTLFLLYSFGDVVDIGQCEWGGSLLTAHGYQ